MVGSLTNSPQMSVNALDRKGPRGRAHNDHRLPGGPRRDQQCVSVEVVLPREEATLQRRAAARLGIVPISTVYNGDQVRVMYRVPPRMSLSRRPGTDADSQREQFVSTERRTR